MADIGPLGRPPLAADSCPSTCCRSSVVEHSIGNGEVDSSILSGSTILFGSITHRSAFSQLEMPEFCSFPCPSSLKRAQGRPGAGWHPWSAARRICTRKCAGGNRWAGKHPAFPARWSVSLYALSPEPSSFWPPSPRELAMSPGPVEPKAISARLDRSNDGQDHMVLPYAAAPSVCTPADLTRFISPWSRLGMPDAAASTAPRSTFAATYDRPSPGPGWRENAAIPNFGKAEYF